MYHKTVSIWLIQAAEQLPVNQHRTKACSSIEVDELCSFVKEYTPAWAAKECNVKEKDIIAFVEEIGEDRPNVIFHPGWNLARYKDSFYSSRAMHILNVLMGNIEMKGGLFIPKGAGDCGKKGIRSIDCGKPDIKRGDGVGWEYTHFDKGPGLAHLFFNGSQPSPSQFPYDLIKNLIKP